MNMAITEFIDFIEVPVKVSLNEYIEISKYYSTNKSSTFINGVLDKIINRLKEEKRIIKQGRGLIGEV
jgi:N utilization substance protein B